MNRLSINYINGIVIDFKKRIAIILQNKRIKLKRKQYPQMTRKIFASTLILIFTLSLSMFTPAEEKSGSATTANMLLAEISELNAVNIPSEEAFKLAYQGYNVLKGDSGNIKKDILTIIDFSLPSTEKRMWIIDLKSKSILFNDYVAHGRNSGEDEVVAFSNLSGSYMSSIGFYITAETYQGKHGLSLRLEGMDDEYNSNARNRAIVMHGADYVSQDFIKQYGRLGRSLGCPSVSMEIHEAVIETIKEGSALFIYYPDTDFPKKSQVLNTTYNHQA